MEEAIVEHEADRLPSADEEVAADRSREERTKKNTAWLK